MGLNQFARAFVYERVIRGDGGPAVINIGIGTSSF